MAKLARDRRHWEKLVAGVAKVRARAADTPTDGGRLSELRDFGSNPGNLRMFLHVPARLPPGAPLVVVLHGCTQTAAGYDQGSGWSTLADRYGFAVLLPQQTRDNNPNTCFTWFEREDLERGHGEPLSIVQMVERTTQDHDIDPRRIFITGLSAGGAMTSVLLATYPDIFAGGAIIAGLPYRAATNVQEAFEAMFQGRSRPASEWGDLVRAASPHRGPWPRVSIWHGGADTTVKPANADETLKQWLDVHGVARAPHLEEMLDGYPRRVWRDEAGQDLVEQVTIPGMAHGTPIDALGGGEDKYGAAAPFFLEVGISSSFHIAKFWGLTDGGAAPERLRAGSTVLEGEVLDGARRAAPPPSARPPRTGAKETGPKERSADQRAATSLDPRSIIEKALKAAGLLKG